MSDAKIIKNLSLNGSYTSIDEIPNRKSLSYPEIGATRGPLSHDNDWLELVKNMPEGPLKIVDFGGGIGIHLNFLRQNGVTRKIDYVIVERPSFVAIGFNGARMVCDIADAGDSMDVFYSDAGIQYADNAMDVLTHVCDMKPSIIMLQRLAIMSSTTYLAVQSWGSFRMPYWVLCLQSLSDMMRDNGYFVAKLNIVPTIMTDVSIATIVFWRLTS